MVHVNSTNYNKYANSCSLYAGRANVSNRYTGRAAAAADYGVFASRYAARTPMARDPWAMAPPPKEHHQSTIEKICGAVGSFAQMFCAGFGMTS